MKKFLLFLMMLLWAQGAWADFQVATGTITTPTSTGNASISGLAFTPKIVFFYSTSNSTFNSGLGMQQAFGVASGSSNEWSFGNVSLKSSATNGRVFKSTTCFSLYTYNSGIVAYLEGNLVSLDSTGFTIDWTTVQGSGHPVYYIALGGSSLNVAVGTFNSGVSTGNQSITGLSFKPNTLLIGNTLSNTTEGESGSSLFSFGFLDSALNEEVSSGLDNTNTASYGMEISTELINRLTTGGSISTQASIVSLDSGGFTVNFTTNTSAKEYGYVALNGVNSKTGNFNEQSGTGNQSVTGIGFTPSVVLFNSAGLPTSTSVSSPMLMSIGGGTASSSSVSDVYDSFNGSTITSASDGSASYAIQFINGSSMLSQASIASLDSSGFTVNWQTNDGTAREITYLALGLQASSSTTTMYNGVNVYNGTNIY